MSKKSMTKIVFIHHFNMSKENQNRPETKFWLRPWDTHFQDPIFCFRLKM